MQGPSIKSGKTYDKITMGTAVFGANNCGTDTGEWCSLCAPQSWETWVRNRGFTPRRPYFELNGSKGSPDLSLSCFLFPRRRIKSFFGHVCQINCLNKIVKKKECWKKTHIDPRLKGRDRNWLHFPLHGLHFFRSLNTHPHGSCPRSQSLSVSLFIDTAGNILQLVSLFQPRRKDQPLQG